MTGVLSPATVFRRTLRPEAISSELRLRAVEWGVLFALSGEHSVAQVGAALGLDSEERDRIFQRLRSIGVIVERPLALGEYLRAIGSVSEPETKSLAEFLTGAPARPVSEPVIGARTDGPAATAASRSDSPSPPLVAQRVGAASLSNARAGARGEAPAPRATPPPFRPLPVPGKESPMPTQIPAASRTLRLRALLAFVVGRAPETEQGQLDVYRAFLKVDPKLLRRNGITTLRFEDERHVNDPELIDAIVKSVEEAIGVPCPADLFE